MLVLALIGLITFIKSLDNEIRLPINEQPAVANDFLQQLKRMLPAEGFLTERIAQLRAKAHRIHRGHIARLEETRDIFARLPASVKKNAAATLTSRYTQ